jgi:isoleucyl-tRNA synthetase
VPIPALVCKACGTHILEGRVVRSLAERAAKEGTDAWFQAPVEEFVPEGTHCSCGKKDFERSTDILDVWFDSGVSHQAVLKGRDDLKLPADLYLEGSDQHRGWFQASLIPSVAIDGRAPYEAVLTHGFVVDGEGRKMSKSLGNVVAPQEVIATFGADILRLWVVASDYNEDVRVSREILKNLAEAYRKVRNTARFLLSNLYDFDPKKDRVPLEEMEPLDRWALARLDETVGAVDEAYGSYRFYVVFQKLFSFCNEVLSSLYLDILKDRLYTSGRTSHQRRSAQTVLEAMVRALAVMLAPAAPFTAEEIYGCIPAGPEGKCPSVHLASWPLRSGAGDGRPRELVSLEAVLGLRPAILKALEEKRADGVLGSSLEARVRLSLKDAGLTRHFKEHADDLRFIFIVSEMEVVRQEDQVEPFVLEVTRAKGKKCARCWNYSEDVDGDAGLPGLCGRCVAAVKESA